MKKGPHEQFFRELFGRGRGRRKAEAQEAESEASKPEPVASVLAELMKDAGSLSPLATRERSAFERAMAEGMEEQRRRMIEESRRFAEGVGVTSRPLGAYTPTPAPPPPSVASILGSISYRYRPSSIAGGHTATVIVPPGKGAMYGAVTIDLDVPSPFPWGKPTFELEVVDDEGTGPGLVLWVRPSNAPRHTVTPRGGGFLSLDRAREPGAIAGWLGARLVSLGYDPHPSTTKLLEALVPVAERVLANHQPPKPEPVAVVREGPIYSEYDEEAGF